MSRYNWRDYKIYGHGINNSPVPINIKGEGKCIYYALWNSMLERCFSEKFHKKQPAYIGTTVEESWVELMTFHYWAKEYGLNKDNKSILQLDKDILVPGAKHYGPETSCFVPRQVNNILIDRHVGYERIYPMGVTYCKRDKYFVATVSSLEKGRLQVSRSKDMWPAHKGFQQGKAQEIENRIAWWKAMDAQDSNYMFQQHVADALMMRANKLREDAANGIETFKI